MSCSTCTSGKGGSPGGCKNNGVCGTGGCNKLNVHNWLTDMVLPEGQAPFNLVEIRFKASRKEFFRNPENLTLKQGDVVAVEASPGHDMGVVSVTGELVRLQMRKKAVKENSPDLKAIYRLAKPMDIEKWEEARLAEPATMLRARSIAAQLKLSMKINDVEYQGDKKKATFYYTAEQRVDFRELIKRLAEEFKVRVEMRQIGMRQEAGRLGGIGDCGRELCCSTWLTNFKSVNTAAARYQNLSLNPSKLAGQCGKLKCCLNYELDSYLDALKHFPDANIPLRTNKGVANHQKTDIFKQMMWFSYGFSREHGGEAGLSDNWVPLHVDRVKEIIAMNKAGQKPEDLADAKQFLLPVEKTPDYENVVGQDSITRMDKKKNNNRNKRRKRPGGGSRPQQKR